MPMTDEEFEDLEIAIEKVKLLVPDLVFENEKGEEIMLPPGPSLREVLEESGQ